MLACKATYTSRNIFIKTGETIFAHSAQTVIASRENVLTYGKLASGGALISQDPIGWSLGQTNGYSFVGGDPVSNTDPSGEAGWQGVAIGAAIDLGLQAFKNYRNGCDVFDPDNYKWYEVGIAGAIGGLSPGWLTVGKNTANSAGAIAALEEQLAAAQTAARAAKIAGRIQNHTTSIANDFITQGAFQGAKYIGNSVGNAASSSCKKSES